MIERRKDAREAGANRADVAVGRIFPRVRLAGAEDLALRVELDRRSLPAELEVDGGINAEIAPRVVRAGGRVLVAGSAVFRSGQTVKEALAKIRASLS